MKTIRGFGALTRHLWGHVAQAAARPLAVAGTGAVIAICAGPAFATPFLEDFDAPPFAGTQISFTSGDFTFTFEASGDGGDFAHTPAGGEGGTGGIDAQSASLDFFADETVTIVRTAGGTFVWDSLYIDNLSISTVFVDGLLGGATSFSDIVLSGFIDTITTGGVLVDTVRLTSSDMDLIFDNFAGELPMMTEVPEPSAFALFVVALGGLGVMARRRPSARLQRV